MAERRAAQPPPPPPPRRRRSAAAVLPAAVAVAVAVLSAGPLAKANASAADVDGGGAGPGGGELDHRACAHHLDSFLTAHSREAIPYSGDNMVYFLHIPRTAGRTLQNCFLKRGTPPSKRCPKAYDHLRIDVNNVPECQLLSSHDDFSVVSMLHTDVSVLSHFRDPVDRFISAYEFAVEVAAMASTRPDNLPPPPVNPDMQKIDNIWPWSYLVPFFKEDMLARRMRLMKELDKQGARDAWIEVMHPFDGDKYYFNMAKQESKWSLSDEERASLLPGLDPYDNPLVLSLEAFARHPIAKQLLHNGQAFQVLGVTNYSHWSDAEVLRSCVWSDAATEAHALRVALGRVGRFFHVGSTARLTESVEAAGAALGFKMTGPAYAEPKQKGFALGGGAASGDGSDGDGGADVVELAGSVRRTADTLQAMLTQLAKLPRGTPAAASLETRTASVRGRLRSEQELLADARSRAAPEDRAASFDAEAGTPGRVPRSKDATGAALLGSNLGMQFLTCARNAQATSSGRREASLARLYEPATGRWVHFSRAARARIAQVLLDEIRALNQLDAQLHARADEMLDARRSEYAAAKVLEDLPPAPPDDEGRRPKKLKGDKFHIPKPADKPASQAEL